MYRIINTITGKIVAECATKQQVLHARDSIHFCFIDSNGELDFSELNVTGHDIAPCARLILMKGVDGLYKSTQVSNRPTRLKFYSVIDDDGRHVDLRTWDSCCYELEQGFSAFYAAYRESCAIAPDATRPERVNGPAMWHRNMRELSAAEVDEFREYMGNSAMPRRRGITKKRCDYVNEQNSVKQALKPMVDRSAKKKRLTNRRRTKTADKWSAIEAEWGDGIYEEYAIA